MRVAKLVLIVLAVLAAGFVGSVWVVGSRLTAAVQREVRDPPAELSVEEVTFPSESGTQISGWFVPESEPRAAVILMHPLRSDRRSMFGRARFLSAAGYAVLLFDFQAHGQSRGDRITFGHRESLDASASVEYVRDRVPDVPIVVLGNSLGGAAALLAEPPLEVEGLVLEAVYPTIGKAIANRLQLRLGEFGVAVAPVLIAQIRPKLGFHPDALRPIERAKTLRVPVMAIAGSDDRRTTLGDTHALYRAIQSEKRLWIVQGAKHENLHRFAPYEYERRVLDFVNDVARSAGSGGQRG